MGGRVDPVFKPDAVFSNNDALSSVIDLRQLSARGLSVTVPSGWTAADIGFQVSNDNVESAGEVTSWSDLRNGTGEGVVISGIQTGVAATYEAPPECWMIQNFRWLRLKSHAIGNFGTGTNQGSGPKTIIVGTLK